MAQDVEGTLGGDAFTFHEDALGLPDDPPGGEGCLEIVVAGLSYISPGLGDVESGAAVGGEDHGLGPVAEPEGVGSIAVEVQGAEATVGGERQAERATDTEARGLRTELRVVGV